MSGVSRFWAWISKARTRSVLAFIGGGVAALVAALWQVYLHFSAPAARPPTPSPVAIAPAAVDTTDAAPIGAADNRLIKSEVQALDQLDQKIDAANNAQAPPHP